MDMPLPLTRELVLIGGGHTHALVLRRWAMAPLAGARLTLINPGPTAPYTGMLPGFVAGHYQRDDLSIDLVRLARFAGARLVMGEATGLDLDARAVAVAGRPPVPFDVASVNVGITSDPPALPGFAEHGIAAKPLGLYARAWLGFRAAVTDGARPARVAVLGGGVGGVELALAMAHALGPGAEIGIIDRGQILDGVSTGARQALLRHAAAAGVRLYENATPSAVTQDAVRLHDGTEVPSAFTVGATGARPHAWLAETGLAHQQGFVTVSDRLQTSDARVFAAGDCVALPEARPKAGVFAVREAPILHHNLRAALAERGPLKPFRPQKHYLKLVSLGPKSAVADKWGGRLQGPWVWRWKDWIDQQFMRKFRELPEMPRPTLPAERSAGLAEALGDKPMCGGCAAKLGPAALSGGLGVATLGDDAAVTQLGGAQLVMTTDHIRGFTLDPHLLARIAAVHALGDAWAMGARPAAVLSSVTLPPLAPHMQSAWLAEINAAAADVVQAAGAEIVGGHTSIGPELSVGFSVTGQLDDPAITLAGARPGDRLILTKPLGSGTILAAEMAHQARGHVVAACLDAMAQPQGAAAAILKGAHAMTDVTGFGLAGHLLNILRASQVGAELNAASIPLMEGALELAEAGVRSSLYAQNRALAAEMTLPEGARAALLFDPQTAGGLLAAVAPTEAAQALTQLRDAGLAAAEIGGITEGPAHLTVRDE